MHKLGILHHIKHTGTKILQPYMFDHDTKQFIDHFINKNKESHKYLLNNRYNKFGFREDTKYIRDDNQWKSNNIIPDNLLKRHCEITGPASNTKLFINAMNSGANCFMADLEDSMTPSWANVVSAYQNLKDFAENNLKYETNEKTYKLNGGELPTLLVRPRGLHLFEKNIVDYEGLPVPAMLVDMAYYAFNYSETNGLYFYIPKMQSYEDAIYVNTLLDELQRVVRTPIKVTCLIETFPAIFQTEEIVYALKDYITGLNCGRWDYLFSYMKTFEESLLPDKRLLTMDKPFLTNYVKQIVKTCHNRGIHAMGGMSNLLPSSETTAFDNVLCDNDSRGHAPFNGVLSDNDSRGYEMPLNGIITDKTHEINLGCDGAWVAHPKLVKPIQQLFEIELDGQNNQIDSKTHEDDFTPCDFVLDGEASRNIDNFSSENIMDNLDDTRQYLESWFGGNGAANINNKMEDMATAEISLTQVKQWLKHGAIIKQNDGYTKFNKHLFMTFVDFLYCENPLVKRVMVEYVLSNNFQFLTEIAYKYLDNQMITFSNKTLDKLSGSKQFMSGVELVKWRGNYFNDFIAENPYYQYLGTSMGISAVNVVAGGKGKIGPYVGGWQTNAMKNRLSETLPDTLHVSPEEPGNNANEINRHIAKADQIQHLKYLEHFNEKGNLIKEIGDKDFNYLRINYHNFSLLADLEQGWSTPEKTRISVKHAINNGINMIHIEDQGPFKRCGHLGDKELAPLDDYIVILKSANLGAQELLGQENAVYQWFRIVARTDAYSAKRIVYSSHLENKDHPDHYFVDFKKGFSADGKYLFLKEGTNPKTGNSYGLDLSIKRCSEVAKLGLVSHVWMETPDADLRVAKAFIEGVNEELAAYGMKVSGLYNHSPSFDWVSKFRSDAVEPATAICDFVRTCLFNEDLDLNTAFLINAVKDFLIREGDHIQSDHLIPDVMIEEMIPHIYSYAEYDNQSALQKIANLIAKHRLQMFEPTLASFGYNAHLVTLPEYHVVSHNMHELAKNFKDDGMWAYVDLVQNAELEKFKVDETYTHYKHQSATGTGVEAQFNEEVGSANTNALEDSTETDDLKRFH